MNSRLRFVVCLTLSMFSGLCSANSSEAETQQIRLGLVSFLGETTTILALETGLFAKHGLEVDVTRSGAGYQSLQGVMAGELDIATVAVTPVVYAAMGRYGPGRDFDVVASILSSTQLNQVVAARGSGIAEPADISGKRVGITLRTASEYLWDLFVQLHNIADVQVRDIPVERMADAMAAGELDASVVWTPFHTDVAAAAPGGGIIFSPGQIYTTNWLVVVDREFSRRHPEAVERYLQVLHEAEEIMRADPAEVAQIVAPLIGVPADALLDLFSVVEVDLELTEAVLLNLSLQAQWAVTRGYVPQKTASDMRTWLDASHLRKVKPRSVSLHD